MLTSKLFMSCLSTSTTYRFLKSGFTRALKYTNPDIIVFLGDLFDEGEIASNYQFDSYLYRFNNVFQYHIPENTKVIYTILIWNILLADSASFDEL